MTLSWATVASTGTGTVQVRQDGSPERSVPALVPAGLTLTLRQRVLVTFVGSQLLIVTAY